MADGAIYSAVRAYLEAQWTTTPLVFENEGQGTGGATVAAFILVEMAGDVYEQASIGAAAVATNRWDEEGVIYLHVCVPSGSGSVLARTHARNLVDLFRGQTLLSGSLEFGAARIGLGQTGDIDGNYYRITAEVEYRRIDA